MMWVDIIAGAYLALWLTMLVTASVYLYDLIRYRGKLTPEQGLLFWGIALSFSGHAFDQSIWTVSNIDRAILGGADLTFSSWIATHAPWIVVVGKFWASLGAFFHLHLFFLKRRPALNVKTLVFIWIAVAMITATLLVQVRLI